MLALFSFLIILLVSSLITRIATVALTLTGVSRDIARFQALSAITGAGFTTSESENIINHPARRRIISLTIRLGGVGFLTTIASLLLTFVNTASDDERLIRVAILAAMLIVFGLIGQSHFVDRYLTRIIQYFLRRWTDLELYDYASMLHLTSEYHVDEVIVDHHSWVADKTLAESELRQEGIIVLGIYRDDESYIGAPRGDTRVCSGDKLIAYGREEDLEEIRKRLQGQQGDEEHEQAVSDQKAREKVEAASDPYSD